MKRSMGRKSCMRNWAGCCLIALLSGSRILGSEVVAEPTRSYVVGYTLEELQDPPVTLMQTITDSMIISLTEVRVGLHLVGDPVGQGWAGDMYVSLNKDLAATAILLNGVGVTESNPSGFGYDGWNVVFRDDAAAGDVHLISPSTSVLEGEVSPDGRLTAEGTERPSMLSLFLGDSGNGVWHLSIADLNAGGRMRLESWSITLIGISSIPEAVFPASAWSVLPVLIGWLSWYRSRRRKMAG